MQIERSAIWDGIGQNYRLRDMMVFQPQLFCSAFASLTFPLKFGILRHRWANNRNNSIFKLDRRLPGLRPRLSSERCWAIGTLRLPCVTASVRPRVSFRSLITSSDVEKK